MKFIVDVPKRYKSCKWNGMVVEKIGVFDEKKGLVLTKNKKGKVITFYWRWLKPILEGKKC